ncbi:single stranded nucleic acid binding protein, partial [Ceratobasidium sp. 428]
TSEMKLLPNIGSDRSWVWNATKYVSGGEPTVEHFAVRFANKNIADEFKLVFENAQASASAYTQHPVSSGKYSQNLS